MAIIPSDYAQVNLMFTGLAAPLGAQITFGVQNAESLWPETIGERVLTLWEGAELDDRQSSAISLTGCLVKVGPNATGAQALVSANIPGKGNAESAPPNVAAIIRKQTQFGGRKGRGRLYMPGIAEANITSTGTMSGTPLTAMQTSWSTFLTGLLEEDIPMVLLHSEQDGGLTPPYVVSSLLVESRIGTQRRRNRR